MEKSTFKTIRARFVIEIVASDPQSKIVTSKESKTTESLIKYQLFSIKNVLDNFPWFGGGHLSPVGVC